MEVARADERAERARSAAAPPRAVGAAGACSGNERARAAGRAAASAGTRDASARERLRSATRSASADERERLAGDAAKRVQERAGLVAAGLERRLGSALRSRTPAHAPAVRVADVELVAARPWRHGRLSARTSALALGDGRRATFVRRSPRGVREQRVRRRISTRIDLLSVPPEFSPLRRGSVFYAQPRASRDS